MASKKRKKLLLRMETEDIELIREAIRWFHEDRLGHQVKGLSEKYFQKYQQEIQPLEFTYLVSLRHGQYAGAYIVRQEGDVYLVHNWTPYPAAWLRKKKKVAAKS